MSWIPLFLQHYSQSANWQSNQNTWKVRSQPFQWPIFPSEICTLLTIFLWFVLRVNGQWQKASLLENPPRLLQCGSAGIFKRKCSLADIWMYSVVLEINEAFTPYNLLRSTLLRELGSMQISTAVMSSRLETSVLNPWGSDSEGPKFHLEPPCWSPFM